VVAIKEEVKRRRRKEKKRGKIECERKILLRRIILITRILFSLRIYPKFYDRQEKRKRKYGGQIPLPHHHCCGC